jgi:hypothetical protein
VLVANTLLDLKCEVFKKNFAEASKAARGRRRAEEESEHCILQGRGMVNVGYLVVYGKEEKKRVSF